MLTLAGSLVGRVPAAAGAQVSHFCPPSRRAGAGPTRCAD